jgi:hypothetical protein
MREAWNHDVSLLKLAFIQFSAAASPTADAAADADL